MRRGPGAAVVVAAVLTMTLVAVPVHAGDLVTVLVNGAINPSVPPGSTVTIGNTFSSLTPNSKNLLLWVAVGTPQGDVYIFVPGNAFDSIEFNAGSIGGQVTCNVPFGGPGSMSVSGQSGTARINVLTPCSGTNPLWKLASGPLQPSDLGSACTAGAPPATTGGLVDGDTTQSGYYGVFTCYDVLTASNSFDACSAPTQIAPCGVQIFKTPEFGSLGMVVGVAAVLMLLLRRRALPRIP